MCLVCESDCQESDCMLVNCVGKYDPTASLQCM